MLFFQIEHLYIPTFLLLSVPMALNKKMDDMNQLDWDRNIEVYCDKLSAEGHNGVLWVCTDTWWP